MQYTNPEYKNTQFDQQTELQRRISSAEEDVAYFLRDIDYEVEKLPSQEGAKKTVITFGHSFNEIDIPAQGTYLVGGAARSAMYELLGMNYVEPRDIDITMILDECEVDEITFPDDSVKELSSPAQSKSEYFTTRDFTLNEILVDSDRVQITPEALVDIVAGIVRLTPNEAEYPHPKLGLKAVRLAVELDRAGVEPLIPYIREANPFNADLFHLSLNTQRAVESGDEAAHSFFNWLKYSGALENYDLGPVHGVDDLLIALEEKTSVSRFEFSQQVQSKIEDDIQSIEHDLIELSV